MQPIDRSPRLLASDARLETPEEMEPVQVATVVIRDGDARSDALEVLGERDRDGDEHARAGTHRGALKAARRHSYDGERHIGHEERAPENTRITSEFALPVRVAQHDRIGLSVETIVLGS